MAERKIAGPDSKDTVILTNSFALYKIKYNLLYTKCN